LKAQRLESLEAWRLKGLMAEKFFLACQPPCFPVSKHPEAGVLDCKYFINILSGSGQKFNAFYFTAVTEYFS
jgi:hypothetical protein